MSEELSCRELSELVTLYLEGALAPAERARFEAHLGECDGCAELLRQWRLTSRAAAASPAEPLPAALEDRLLAAFRGWKGARP